MQDSFRRHLVLWLVGRQASLGELAALSGKSMSTMFGVVRQLERLGLVRIASTLRRSGRPIKKYTATAGAFFAPAELGLRMVGTALEEELQASLELAGSAFEGTLYYKSSSGEMRIKPVRAEGAPNVRTADEWRIVALGADQFQILLSEVKSVLDRAETAQVDGPRYLIRFAAAPTSADAFFEG